MINFLITLLVLAVGIGLLIMAGTVLLPVVALLFVIWFIAALFGAGRRNVSPPEPEEPSMDDIPASQAVIDVEAVAVSDDDAGKK